MKVYILIAGFFWEGSTILGLFRSEEGARRRLEKLLAEDQSIGHYDWVRVDARTVEED